MSEQIDWSKAPEGAMVLLKHVRDDSYAWAVSHSEGARAWHRWNIKCSFDLMASKWGVVAERPTTPSWPVEGLPPVGVVCEVKLQEEWSLCEIIAHFQQPQAMVAAFTVAQFHGGKKLDSKIAECFRPIRTPEQIAADARSKAIDEMVKALGMDDPGTAECIRCGLIYDAGFRKP